VGLGQRIVDFERLLCGRPGQWKRFLRSRGTKAGEKDIRISKPGIRQRVAWIFFDRFAKIDRLRRTGPFAKKPPLPDKLMGLRFRSASAMACCFRRIAVVLWSFFEGSFLTASDRNFGQVF
jgi:hypothetical protein